jgi:predicted ATP-grasp superfamily ATP-dependent carboligase
VGRLVLKLLRCGASRNADATACRIDSEQHLHERIAMIHPPTTPAIVMGREQTALGALRSLRMVGIDTYVACPPGDLVRRSRWYRPVPGAARWDGRPGPNARDALASSSLERAVLIPCNDAAALWVSDIPHGPLRDRFLVSSSSHETLQILGDKSRFGQLLAGTAIPHPRTFTIRSAADIAALPFDSLDRVFVKPADSQAFLRATGVKGLWARDRDEFEAIWKRLDGQNLAVIAQEYIPGGADDHYFIDGFRDRRGVLTALFARRRVRISPPDFGSSSYCISIPMQDVDAALPGLTELLERLEYRGIFSAEFKRDARDGAFRILEVNARAWWYVEFATRCGVNVVEMAWRDALDMPVARAPANYLARVGCINLRNDLATVFARHGATRTPFLLALRQWLRGHFNIFRMDDPLPGLQVARQAVTGALARRFHRLLTGDRRTRTRKPMNDAQPTAPATPMPIDAEVTDGTQP